MLTCRSLRGAVITSGSLLVAAWSVEMLATRGVLPTVSSSYLGLALLFAAAAVLGVTFLRSLLPKNAARLAGCEH